MEEIGRIRSISRISLGKWFTRYESDGLVGLGTGQGRKVLLRIENQADAERLEGWVADNAQNLRPVLAQIEEHFGWSVCKRTLQRLLKKKTTPGSASAKARRESSSFTS
jgi:transposase